jgi:hypothetical protein
VVVHPSPTFPLGQFCARIELARGRRLDEIVPPSTSARASAPRSPLRTSSCPRAASSPASLRAACRRCPPPRGRPRLVFRREKRGDPLHGLAEGRLLPPSRMVERKKANCLRGTNLHSGQARQPDTNLPTTCPQRIFSLGPGSTSSSKTGHLQGLRVSRRPDSNRGPLHYE